MLQHFWDIFFFLIFFLLVSKKWAGGNGFPRSMPRMTQPCPHKRAEEAEGETGRKDEGWHRMWALP